MSRRTVAREASLEGIGLHTGATATVTCRPAAGGSGIVFRRTDLPGAPAVRARVSEVEATERRTAIGHGETTIHTVEHLLAAVGAAALDDLEIRISGPEPPILDGSFAPYQALLAEAGVAEQEGEPAVYAVAAPFTVREGDASYVVAPHDGLRLTTTIEWDHPLIGRQTGSFEVTAAGFAAELAAARTFGFTREVEALRAQGLLRGASTDSAVVLSDTEVVGTALRWPDEFLRHKTGDILGDLVLVGGRVRAHVVATRPSHRGNVAVARAIARRARSNGHAMDINRILDVIPHRYPMLLVDRILEVEDDRRIVGIKNVTINEPFFQGHFPGHPIMPGVLIIEAMAQVGGFLLMGTVDDPENKVVYFMSLDHVKFRRPVVPGDQLRFELEMLQHRGRTCRMKGTAWVDGTLVAEAEMMARVVDK
jgi:UDP-3-O-[3-hydroxymyristoyl] N-acetylglucosamine deacetylase / 3-hydroxyacyl-[acyl-carrier-protein] dehydratase